MEINSFYVMYGKHPMVIYSRTFENAKKSFELVNGKKYTDLEFKSNFIENPNDYTDMLLLTSKDVKLIEIEGVIQQFRRKVRGLISDKKEDKINSVVDNKIPETSDNFNFFE